MNQRWMYVLVRGWFLVAWLLAAGCGATQLRANIVVEADANSNSPVMISAVFIYRAKLLGKLQEMTAAQWFQKREQLLRDHPKDLEEISWEFVPGQQVPPFEQKLRGRALQGILFANYKSPGAHRYFFDPKRPQDWACGLREIRLEEVDPRPAKKPGSESKSLLEKVKDHDPR